MGTLVSALGVYLSVLIDLPTGATIVCTFGVVLALMFLVYSLVPALRGSREIHDAHEVAQ
jgi:ABC-type Mn2+/Zn2+ transport system permease subunit